MTSTEAINYLAPIRDSSHMKTYQDALTVAINALMFQRRHENPKTIGDRIRAMTDEELADAILRYTYGSVDPANWFCKGKKECGDLMDADKEIPDEMCKACILEKLRQPAKEV